VPHVGDFNVWKSLILVWSANKTPNQGRYSLVTQAYSC